MKTTNNLTSPPREKTSVAIQGIDRSTPDDIVTDGACATLKNARFKDGAWRPVCKHKIIKRGISLPLGTNIIYHHPAGGDGKYITELVTIKVDNTKKYTYALYDSKSSTSTTIITLDEMATVSHFGNVLILASNNSLHYFLLKDGSYKPYSIPPEPKITLINNSFTPVYPDLVNTLLNFGTWEKYSSSSSTARKRARWAVYDLASDSPMIATSYTNTDGRRMWMGEIAYFCAYRMADGTIVPCTPIKILTSEDTSLADSNIILHFSLGVVDEKVYLEQRHENNMPPENTMTCNQLKYIAPSLGVTLPNSIDKTLFTSFVVFTTRLNSIIELKTARLLSDYRGGSTPPYQQNDLLNQPFYIAQEIPMENFVANIDLSYDVLENAVTNAMYTPSNNSHTLVGDTSLDYNSRLHLAALSIIPNKGYNSIFDATGDGDAYNLAYDIDIDNTTYTVGYSELLSSNPISPSTNVITYPDYRARLLRIFSSSKSASFKLTPAIANNVAYYTAPSTRWLKYPPITATYRDGEHTPITISSSISQPNRIQVSATNNCFSFPFENNYAVGSANNRIIAMQSAAIKIGDEKVGALPLYVFTTEGIYALRAGEETLYATVNPVNYDKIINPNTLAINGAIVYITDKGVHMLTSQGTQVISTPIHDAAGRPPLDFLRNCKIIYPKQYNEVVFLDESRADGEVYVYNIDAEYWSTRTLKGKKLNTDELCLETAIYDLADEDESQAERMTIHTRPIKLGNVEYKRLDTIIPRLSTGDNGIIFNLSINGSVDGSNYHELRKVATTIPAEKINPVVVRRTPFSAKYFKCSLILEGDGSTYNSSITHIDFEWYMKFKHRMR